VKPTRKNRFKKENAARRARLRERIAFSARTVAMIALLVTASAGFILVYDFFVQSDQFRVQEIVVDGNRRMGQQEVLEIAGIDSQTNILSLNLTTTRKRLLADPWIADATVGRKIPSGLIVSIREEQPLALLAMGAGQSFLLNAAGQVFKRSAGAEGANLPQIEGLRLADLPVTGKPDTEAFRAVMALLGLAREQSGPLAQGGVVRVHMDREIGATVYTGEGKQAIKLGFGHYREKCSALRYLTVRMKNDGRLAHAQVIDLNDVNRIVITLAPSGESGSDQEEV
jgi:cell division protein FtsQ